MDWCPSLSLVMAFVEFPPSPMNALYQTICPFVLIFVRNISYQELLLKIESPKVIFPLKVPVKKIFEFSSRHIPPHQSPFVPPKFVIHKTLPNGFNFTKKTSLSPLDINFFPSNKIDSANSPAT